VAIYATALRSVVEDEDRTPKQLLVFDRTCREAGRTNWTDRCETPIVQGTRQGIADAFADGPRVRFIAEFDPLFTPGGFLKGHALLILLGPVQQSGDQATLGVNYTNENPSQASNGILFRLERSAGGWRVTGGRGVGAAA
jgi:hypothetical protein